MTTTNYTFSDPGIVLGGSFIPNNVAPHTSWTSWPKSEIDFACAGTQAVMPFLYANAVDITVSIDGGSATAISGLAGGWNSNITLFTGLSDSVHTVRIVSAAGMGFDSTAGQFLAVTGAAPSLSYLTGFGPPILLNSTGVSNKLLVTGLVPFVNSGNALYQPGADSNQEIWFYASMTSFGVRAFSAGINYRLMRTDTKDVFVGADDNSSQWKWTVVATGLDSARHLWKLTISSQQSPLIQQFMCNGGSGFDLTTAPPTLPVICNFGDSITQGNIGTNTGGHTHTWDNWTSTLAEALGMSSYNLGINSSPVSTAAGSTFFPMETSARTNAVIATGATRVTILGGINDIVQLVSIGTFTTSFQNMCTELQTGLPSAQYYVIAILPGSEATQSQLDPYNAAIASVVGGMPANWHFVDSKPWNLGGIPFKTGGALDPTNYIDTLHPNAAGSVVIETNLLAAMSPAASHFNPSLFSLSPLSGGVL